MTPQVRRDMIQGLGVQESVPTLFEGGTVIINLDGSLIYRDGAL